MRRRHWTTLTRLYLERSRRGVLVMLFSTGPLCLFFAQKGGYQPADVAMNLLVVTALFPLSLGGLVGRCKADDSLAFLASLPVSPVDHARSWLALCALMSTPAALSAVLAVRLGTPLGPGEALVAGVGVLLLGTAGTMLLIALQLGAVATKAAVYGINAFVIFLMSLAGFGTLYEELPQYVAPVLRSPLLLPVVSLVLWSTAAATLWWSWHRVGHYMTSYVGEPPRA